MLTELDAANAAVVTHAYDNFNSLTSTVIGSTEIAYAYNAQGIRTARYVGNTLTQYLLDGGNVTGEVVNGTISAAYIRGANLIMRQGNSSAVYYLYNAHGDVVQLTDSTGTVTKTYDYDAFGNEENPSASDVNPFRYCGEYFDTETGLYYLRARYYDPTVGRFTQEDTYRGDYKDPLSLNYYVYCYNNPVIYFDVDGHMPVKMLNALSYSYNRNIWSAQEVSVQTIIGNGKNIYNAFHEIAQLNLAKHLYGLGYSPLLEYKIPNVGEADVVAANMAWEIKPIGKSGFDQLQKYLVGGGLVTGHEFWPISDIPIFGKFKMAIFSSGLEPGVAHYVFYYSNKEGELCYVPSSEVKRAAENRVTTATTTVGAVMLLTLVENFLTAGVGVADDPASFAAALGLGSSILAMP